jgi:gas vesicle protein
VQRATAGSPLIAGAVAFGIGALVAAVLPATESERRALETMQPQVDAATNAMKDVGQQAIATAKSAAQDAAHDVKATATEHAHEVADQAKEAGKQVEETGRMT